MKNADYRKINDGSLNSSKYHKKDSTYSKVRAKLKVFFNKYKDLAESFDD